MRAFALTATTTLLAAAAFVVGPPDGARQDAGSPPPGEPPALLALHRDLDALSARVERLVDELEEQAEAERYELRSVRVQYGKRSRTVVSHYSVRQQAP